MLRGALRIQGAQPIRERSEITKEILEAIATTFKPTYDELNLRTAFCVAFAAFLQPSEFTWESWDANKHTTHMTRESVQFTTEGVLLHLPKSKTDQFRQGHTIPLAFSGDSTCPVKALQMLLTAYPKPKSEPLFSRTLGPFNKRWLADNLSTALLHAGYDPTTYSGHSFRRGAANSAVAAGISRENVKILGRWKSDAVNRYFTAQTANIIAFSANKQLHLAPSQRKTALILRSAPQPPREQF